MELEPLVAAVEDSGCTFGRCFCCWLTRCSSRIPPVAPGRDYDRTPLGADHRAAWSLLIGYHPPSSAGTSLIRLRRFRVARSGRVLGRSDDALEILNDVDYDAKGELVRISAAAATPSADGRSLALCLFCLDFNVHVAGGEASPPCPMELLLELNAADTRISLHSTPHLPPLSFMSTCPISAAGKLWTLGFLNHCGPTSLVMLRLDKESEKWVQVATMEVTDCGIYGYAVVHDTILLSLEPERLFVVFNCATCAWTAVKTDTKAPTFDPSAWIRGEVVIDYIPICGRGLYVEEHDTIYFLRDNIIYAYKLCYDQDQRQYWMAMPTIVDRLCPFGREGSGFLTHLGGQVMCFVWISVPSYGWQRYCNCDTFHVLITTFQVIGNSGSSHEHFIPKGVQVLHSTCRRLDIDPSKSSLSDYMFCFLREYEENTLPPAKKKRENEMTPSMRLELMGPATSNVAESSKMLTCCRKFFSKSPYILALRLEKSVIQTTKDLYIVCQAPSHATVFKINIRDGKLACHNQNLKPYGVMDTFVCSDPDDLMEQPFPWHFTCDRKSIYAVPDKRKDIHVLSLDKGSVISLEATGPTGTDFSISLVLAVGSNIIAISDTLGGVYHLSDTHEWVPHNIQRSVDLEKKVELSGYAVLSDKSFVVCDRKTECCFLFDLDKDTWSIVRAYSDISSSLPIVQPTEWSESRFLRGRSVLAEGFIYTCADGGLRAYEIIKVQDSYCLSEGIFLKFPWLKYWGSDRMCLDYVGQDTASGAIMFCVVQGNNYDQHRLDAPDKHRVLITTIQIKTERTSRFTLKPVAVGHADGGTSFVGQDGGPIWTSSCFAP